MLKILKQFSRICFLKFLLIQLLLLSFTNQAAATDFTFYPEDKTITADFIYSSTEQMVGAYYWADTGVTNTIYDNYNGITINPYNAQVRENILNKFYYSVTQPYKQ
jgi:hypothetical protein